MALTRGAGRVSILAVACFLSLSFLTGPTRAEQPGASPAPPVFDSRLPAEESARGGFVLRAPTGRQLARAAELAARSPGLTLRWDGISGAPKWLAAGPREWLSPPRTGSPEETARAFLLDHAELIGLRPATLSLLEVTDVVSSRGGSRHVHFVQRYGPLEVHGTHVNVNLSPDNGVRSAGLRLFAGIRLAIRPQLSPVDAGRLAVASVYPETPFVPVALDAEEDGERRMVFDGTGFARPNEIRLVVFPTAESARLAWEVRTAEPSLDTSYLILVDAEDGTILYRWNEILQADARRLEDTNPDPEVEEVAPVNHTLAEIPASTPASPVGWLDGDGSSLSGNNATSHLLHWSQPGLTEPSGQYDYAYNTVEAAVVNAWWWANEAHDRFYALGFDEEAGNFQQDNDPDGDGTAPGVGGDPLAVVAYRTGGRNNAYFGPFSADGDFSAIRFYWNDCLHCADHDGDPGNGGDRSTAFMRDAVYHEYTHGASTRMVGGPATPGCLTEVQSAALGEAWSDTFAASFTSEPRVATHWNEGGGWLRGLVHDLEYGELCHISDSGCQVHSDGMIFGGTLWDLRESMRALQGESAVPVFEEILVGGLARTPCSPSMLDARDAILEADSDLNGSANHTVIWNVFADRGMGDDASTTGETDTAPVAGYAVPAGRECTPPGTPTGLTASPTGPNVVTLSYGAPGASAIEVWREDLDIPFDRPVRIAFTTDTASFEDTDVHGGRSYRYHLVALGAAGLGCRSGSSGTADATATGACDAPPVFSPNLVVSDPGDCSLELSWSAASPGCPASPEPIVYNVYRAIWRGYEPAGRHLIGRTSGTTFSDNPPEKGLVSTYLVLAQHGTVDDPPDHRVQGASQLLRWVAAAPTHGRVTTHLWDFDDGAQGWTVDNSADPTGGWVLVDPTPTYYCGMLANPDEPAGGTGLSWVTGDADPPLSMAAHDCDARAYLESPTWDATDGSTILSLDYWAHIRGRNGWLAYEVSNGATTVVKTVSPFMTVQSFDTPARNSWQRYEIDLAYDLEPTATMSLRFYGDPQNYVSEFGLDNVRISRGTGCAASGLDVDWVTVDDSPPGWGNGNGALEAGETAKLILTVRNDGAATAFSPRAVATASTAGLIVHEDTALLPDIAPGGSEDSYGDGITVTLPPHLGCLESISLDIVLSDASETEVHETWNRRLGLGYTEIVFSDTFETDKGWESTSSAENYGRWERGDPVGTMDGSNQANPEDDSPNDAGTFCYVTDNGNPGWPAALNDVDSYSGSYPILWSPGLPLSGLKSARVSFDIWYYDNETLNLDFGFYQTWFNPHAKKWYHYPNTVGWETVTKDITDFGPLLDGYQFLFAAYDRGADHLVEMGVDNFVVEGDRQVCDPLGIDQPPNGVGDTLRIASVDAQAEISWQASPADPDHDDAAYYEVYVSASADGGFEIVETATLTGANRPLDPVTEFFRVTAVNAAGSSGDEPTP